jgi:cholesterol transport system auxiliary component
MTIRYAVLMLGALAMVSGCSLLPERPAKATYMLRAPDVAPTDQHPVALTLRVLTPHAEAPLSGNSILVNPRGESIQAYGGARWSKRLPLLVRDHWIEGLRQSGGLKAVVTETSDAMSNLVLGSNLTRFQLHYPDGEPEVVVQLDVQLLETTTREVVATQRFRVNERTADQPAEAVISGFSDASQALTENLVAWLLDVSQEIYGETNQARPPSDTESSTTR